MKAGKLRSIGASNFEAPRLAEAAKISKDKGLPRYESLQPHYNLMERGLFEGALEDECLKEGIGVIPYYSLASGFLSGKYRSEADVGDKARGAGVKKYINPKGIGVLKALDDAARKHNSNPTQVALAWLMQRKSITAPIVSATSLEQLKDLIAAPNDQARLRSRWPPSTRRARRPDLSRTAGLAGPLVVFFFSICSSPPWGRGWVRPGVKFECQPPQISPARREKDHASSGRWSGSALRQEMLH